MSARVLPPGTPKCSELPPEIFDLEHVRWDGGYRTAKPDEVDAAVMICETVCPVFDWCRQATATAPIAPTEKIQAGLVWLKDGRPITAREFRKNPKRKAHRDAPPKESPSCGTEAGVSQHRRRGEQRCRACDEMRNAKERVRKRARIKSCPQGHAYTPDNTWYDRAGSKRCQICVPRGGRVIAAARARVGAA